MGRALVGAVAAAVAMFIIGFIFYATPLQKIAVASADNAQAAAVQQALAANLPRTGTYFIPSADTAEQSTMYSQGPIAMIHYNMSGFSVASPDVMIAGFIHMLVVTLLMAAGLYLLARRVTDFAEQAKLLGLGILGAMIFIRLGPPIWYHQDWPYAIYTFLADTISLGVAGLIILKLLARWTGAAAATAATAAPSPSAPGSTSDL
jgi:hypothetical protein